MCRQSDTHSANLLVSVVFATCSVTCNSVSRTSFEAGKHPVPRGILSSLPSKQLSNKSIHFFQLISYTISDVSTICYRTTSFSRLLLKLKRNSKSGLPPVLRFDLQ